MVKISDTGTQGERKKAAEQIAEIIYASLQQFTETEQQKRVKEIQEIGRRAGFESR
jgi:hypothetical protein